MKPASLSPLAKVFLEHFEEIMAGYDALRADIPVVLRAVSRHAPEAVLQDFGLERVWTRSESAKLVLRLRWNRDCPWPALTINDDEAADSHKHAKYVFDRAFLDSQQLPSVDPAALLQDATAECVRLWQQASEQCERLFESEGWRMREGGMRLVPKVGASLARRLIDAGLPPAQANAARKLVASPTWPLYPGWQDQRASDGQNFYWYITFNPAYGHMHRETAPFLGLVAYPTKATRGPLAELKDVPWEYQGCPVLVDATAQLMAYVQGQAKAEDLIQDLCDRALKQYHSARTVLEL